MAWTRKTPATPDFGQWTFPRHGPGQHPGGAAQQRAAGLSWGEDFRYDEAVLSSSRSLGRPHRHRLTAGMLAPAATPPANSPPPVAVSRRGAQQIDSGKTATEILLHAVAPTEDRTGTCVWKVTGDMDPGLWLHPQRCWAGQRLPGTGQFAVGGGFWTPASAMGANLQRRLAANAGLSLEFVDPPRVARHG